MNEREGTGVKAKNGKKHSIEARKTLRSKAYGRRQDSIRDSVQECTSLSVVVATSFLSVETTFKTYERALSIQSKLIRSLV